MNGGDDKIYDLIQQDSNDVPHQSETQFSSSVTSCYQGLHGKVALKVKPFNFEAMSCIPKTMSQGPIHRPSLDIADLVNMSNTCRLATPRAKTRHEGENNRVSMPLALVKKLRRFREKPTWSHL